MIATFMSTETLAKRSEKAAGTSYSSSLSSTPWGNTFGLGLQLGAPTALTAKLKLEHNSAVTFTLGGGWSWGIGSGLEFSVGYVVHPSVLGSYEALTLSWYVGGAVDVMLRSGQHYNYYWAVIPIYTNSPIGLGAHMPLGLDFQMRPVPLSVYLELTPGIDLFPVVGPRVGLALGARFFF
jgi:hypothetical protein